MALPPSSDLLDEAPYPSGSDEAICAEAHRDAYYSIFHVESREPGVGVHVYDVVREENILIHDVGLSGSAPPGFLFAGRLLCPENIPMTTSAVLPFGVMPKHAFNPEEPAIKAMKAFLGKSCANRRNRSPKVLLPSSA